MNRILIVEDEPRITLFLEKGFRANGFMTAVARDGQAAIQFALEDEWDLVILDLGLPGKDGLSVLEELRGQGFHHPVIILTARDDVRVRARLRVSSTATGQTEMVLRANNIALDLRTRRVYAGDRLVELSAREFTLAETFLRHPEQVMSREQLLNHVWGYDYDPGSNIVDVYVGYLRKKLGDELIETVRGVGYRLRSSG
jgi:two-component system response regulator QseB